VRLDTHMHGYAEVHQAWCQGRQGAPHSCQQPAVLQLPIQLMLPAFVSVVNHGVMTDRRLLMYQANEGASVVVHA